MPKGLYTRVLEDLHPGRMLRTHSQGEPFRLRATAKPVPTNEEILESAIRTYNEHIDVVDSNTTSGMGYVQLPGGKPNVAALNAYNWKSQQAGPITPTAELVESSATFKPGVQAAKSDKAVASLVMGISESAQFIVGEEGGVGIAIPLGTGSAVKGAGYVAGKLGLDIDVAINLNVGIWGAPPEKLAGSFFGVQVNLDLEVGVSLGIYVSGDELHYMGFSVGIGVGLGGGATIVGGYTWVF
jgi:hypothetical protein